MQPSWEKEYSGGRGGMITILFSSIQFGSVQNQVVWRLTIL